MTELPSRLGGNYLGTCTGEEKLSNTNQSREKTKEELEIELLQHKIANEKRAAIAPPGGSKPGTAIVLSFLFPGLGQMYRGRIGAGLAWMVFVLAGYFMLIIPGLVLHLFCIMNAGSNANANLRQRSKISAAFLVFAIPVALVSLNREKARQPSVALSCEVVGARPGNVYAYCPPGISREKIGQAAAAFKREYSNRGYIQVVFFNDRGKTPKTGQAHADMSDADAARYQTAIYNINENTNLEEFLCRKGSSNKLAWEPCGVALK